MRVGTKLLFATCWLLLANAAFATTSTCYEYYIGSTPYVAHQSTYSSGDAALGPTFGMKTEVTYPSLPVIDSYWSASSSGGSQTIADTPYSSGYWGWSGAAAIGTYNAPEFYYETSTFSQCSHSQTYGNPTGVFVDINPNTAIVGQTVYFSWGASGVVNQCTLGGSPLSPTQGSNVPVVVSLSDAGTYTVYCSNYWGQSTSPGQDTLVVNECSDASNPAPLYDGSTYNPSFFSSVSPYIGGGMFGNTQVGGYITSACPEVCSGGTKKYRLEGGAVTDSTSFMKISTHLEPIVGSSCTTPVARTTSNINWTEQHESIHAVGFKSAYSVGNDWMQTRPLYDTLPLCEAARTEFAGVVAAAITAESAIQGAHADHADQGLYSHGTTCSSDVLTEVQTSPY